MELEKAVSDIGKNIANFYILNVAGRMVEEIMKEQDRKKVMEMFLGNEDVTQLNKLTITILLNILRQYESKCDISESAKAGNLLRREVLITGSCWAYGSSVHRMRVQSAEGICDKMGHNTKVCISLFKMCHSVDEKECIAQINVSWFVAKLEN